MRLNPLLLLALFGCSAAPGTTTPPPADTTNDAKCSSPRPSATHECTQDCGPPVASEGDPEPGWQWLTAEDAASRRQYGCPRCLPEDTLIDTPEGQRSVTELKRGDLIWTLDLNGRRVVGQVEYAGSTPIVAGHTLVQITLADGRVVRASAGHPDAGGNRIDALATGMEMSDSTIVSVETLVYEGERTHDVLPSGPTGIYWADGVKVQSSFASRVKAAH